MGARASKDARGWFRGEPIGSAEDLLSALEKQIDIGMQAISWGARPMERGVAEVERWMLDRGFRAVCIGEGGYCWKSSDKALPALVWQRMLAEAAWSKWLECRGSSTEGSSAGRVREAPL